RSRPWRNRAACAWDEAARTLRNCEPNGGGTLAGGIDRGKAGRGQPLRRTVAMLADLEAHIARAQRCVAAPGQRLAAAHRHMAVAVHGFGIAVEAARLVVQVGSQA